jgi:hypothetical protein
MRSQVLYFGIERTFATPKVYASHVEAKVSGVEYKMDVSNI